MTVALAVLVAAITGPIAARAATEKSFGNPNPITIEAASSTAALEPATPYPSEIEVSRAEGEIAHIAVKLRGLSVTRPYDIDVLLVSPDKTAVILMDNVGGFDEAVRGVKLTFDDNAAGPIPAYAPPASGTYRPSVNPDKQSDDTLPEPAPPPNFERKMAAFEGRDPNGIWSLYVASQSEGAGSIVRGWKLMIETAIDRTGPCPPPFPSEEGGRCRWQVSFRVDQRGLQSHPDSPAELTKTKTAARGKVFFRSKPKPGEPTKGEPSACLDQADDFFGVRGREAVVYCSTGVATYAAGDQRRLAFPLRLIASDNDECSTAGRLQLRDSRTDLMTFAGFRGRSCHLNRTFLDDPPRNRLDVRIGDPERIR